MNYSLIDIDKSINTTMDELFIDIAKNVQGFNFGAEDLLPEDLVKIGIKWYKNFKKNAKDKLCSKLSIISLKKNETKAEIVSLIIDAINAVYGNINFPILTLSTLIFKEGIQNFCDVV